MRNRLLFGIVTILLAACAVTVASPFDENTIPSDLSDIPLYPGTDLIWEGIPGKTLPQNIQATHTVYSYTVKDNSKNIEIFYTDEMQTVGWELLGKMDGAEMGNSLLFAKSERIVTISIIPWTPLSYLVTIDIIIDPSYKK